MRASGLISKAAHEKITMRHLGAELGDVPPVALSVTLPSQCIHAPTWHGEGDDDERRGSGTR